MPIFKSLLRHYFSSETVLYECRNCGQTLEEDVDQCTECGAENIAKYQFNR